MSQNKLRTFMAIRKDIEALERVTNKETFLAAIPLLVEMTTKLSMMRRTLKTCGELANELNEACSFYALDHMSVFVNGLVTDGKGVKHGDVDVNGTIYHFSSGFGGFVRLDGDNLTQGFLDRLPDDWKKDKIEIDATAMAKLGVTEEELTKAGLVRKAKLVWSLPAVSDTSAE